MENGKNTTLAFMFGLIAGGITALLMAPDSGRETRRRMRQGLQHGAETASDGARRAREQVEHYSEEVRRRAENVSELARHKVGGLSGKAGAQVDAVKEAWHEGKDAYHRELEQRRGADGGEPGGEPSI